MNEVDEELRKQTDTTLCKLTPIFQTQLHKPISSEDFNITKTEQTNDELKIIGQQDETSNITEKNPQRA